MHVLIHRGKDIYIFALEHLDRFELNVLDQKRNRYTPGCLVLPKSKETPYFKPETSAFGSHVLVKRE